MPARSKPAARASASAVARASKAVAGAATLLVMTTLAFGSLRAPGRLLISRWLAPLVLAVAMVALTGCAGQVVWLGEPPPPLAVPPAERLSFTVAVASRSFEAKRIDEKGVLDRFAAAVRSSDVFLNVMYPIPPGVDPE